ncbi:MAG: ribokinase [Roseobacter sp.]
MRVLVVGALHLDVVLRAPHLPQLDETVAGSGVDYVFGGKGGNQAVAAARLGSQVSFAGRAGSDQFGDRLRNTLHQAGIDTRQLQKDEGPSGMSAAIVDAHGDYGAVIVSAANLLIDAHHIDIPQDTRLVVLQNEIPPAVNLAVAQKARAAGVPVWLNAAPARKIEAALLAEVSLLIVNRVEAAFYAGLPNPPDMVHTLGADGVAYQANHYPGYRVDVMSTHGAGDVFVGALAARVVEGADIAASLEFAQAAAALHVSMTHHTRTSLSRQSVLAFQSAYNR